MAYKTIVKKYYANRDAFLSDLFSALEDMGWTLEDDQGDASSYKVYSSPGEAADRIAETIQISWSSTGINFTGYYAWDSTNHVGLGKAYATMNLSTSDSGFYGWVYGNADFVVLMTKVGTTYDYGAFGHAKRFWQTPLAKLTSAATSGSDVLIEVDDVSNFIIGKKYQIVGASKEGRWMVEVEDIPDSTHLKIVSLPSNFSTGTLIGAVPSTFGVYNPAYFYLTCGNSVAGTNYQNVYCNLRVPFDYGYLDPDQRKNAYVLTPVFGEEYNTFSVPVYFDDPFLYAPTGSPEDVFYTQPLDSGTSSGSNSTNTLNDSTKSWGSNAFAGDVIVITGGPGQGEVHKISSNTGTEITIEDEWVATPDNTSTYVIATKAYRKIANITNGFACREGS